MDPPNFDGPAAILAEPPRTPPRDADPRSGFMLGAIVGDVAGSTYEHDNCKSYEDVEVFRRGSRFTDDTVLTVATADRYVSDVGYGESYREWGASFPKAGYGGNFRRWLRSKGSRPYGSWGNGSAMRASPIGWAAGSVDEALEEARKSAEVTHDHPEGVKGAQAVAAAVYLARTGRSKGEIRDYVSSTFGYDLDRTVDEIRPEYGFDVSCPGSVPEAIIAFLDSSDFEDAIKKAISLGGDSDTIACITGAISQAFYRSIPAYMTEYCRKKMTGSQLFVLDEFCEQYVKDAMAAGAEETGGQDL